MPSKTVEILLGTPLETVPEGLPNLSTSATLRDAAAGGADEVAGRRTAWRIAQCPGCQALSYLDAIESLPGWTTCEQCGQTFQIS